MKVNEMPEPLYILVESVYVKIPSADEFDLINFNIYPLGLMTWKKFREKYGSCYVCSVRDYDDTETTSIIFSNIDPGHEPLRSVHTKEHKIKWLKG